MYRMVKVSPFAYQVDKWKETEAMVRQGDSWAVVSDMEHYKEYADKEIGAYTTWVDDPSTSIMIHYQVFSMYPVECLLRKAGDTEWSTLELFAAKSIPYTDTSVRWYKADNLTPDTVYETKLEGHSREHKFKTMPSTHTRDIKVLLTGDQMNSVPDFIAEAPQGFQVMYDNNIDVIAIAGDGVHDQAENNNYWVTFWTEYFASSMLNDGFMIPIVYAFGNHDGRATPSTLLWYTDGATKDSVLFQYNFFSNLNDVGYGAVDIGNYLSLLFLNSGHTAPVAGDQTTWLSTALQARTGRHIFPFFHVSPYPGHYPYEDTIKVAIRTNWNPLFSQYGVKVVGTSHEHVSMVTKKVLGDAVDETDGIVYVGEGFGMGTVTRTGNTSEAWYIDYFSDTTKDFDVLEFKSDGTVAIKQIGLTGSVLNSETL